MHTIEHHHIDLDGLTMHVAAAGRGPAVVLCHGFPGLWYSWRHQLPALAAAGYRAIAVDQRGYGQTDRPVDPARYDANHALADMLNLLDALGERTAVFVGHDFGAQQVCNLAVRHASRVAGAVVMSCPYDFDLAGRGGTGRNPDPRTLAQSGFATGTRPSEAFAAIAEAHFFHMHYFQSIGPPERELGAAPRTFLKRLFWALSADGTLTDYRNYPSRGTGYLDVLAEAPPLPWAWMDTADLDYFVEQFMRGGAATAFIGGLGCYRAADRNWELGEPYADADIEVPTLFLAGAADPVLEMLPSNAIDVMQARTPDLRGVALIEHAGHFVQMEQPAATNRALLDFLATLTFNKEA